MTDRDAHSRYSSLRELIVEHLFIGELLRHYWTRGIHDVEVMRSEIDAYGYDLVVARGPIVRHVQLKSGIRARPEPQTVARILAEKPSGCVLFVQLGDTLDLGPFRWMGGSPGDPLPRLDRYRSARHTKGNAEGLKAERQGHAQVPISAFETLPDLPSVAVRLLGV